MEIIWTNLLFSQVLPIALPIVLPIVLYTSVRIEKFCSRKCFFFNELIHWTPVCTGMHISNSCSSAFATNDFDFQEDLVRKQCSGSHRTWQCELCCLKPKTPPVCFETSWIGSNWIQSTRHFKGVGLSRSLVVGISIWQSVFDDDAAASRPVAMFLLDQDLVGEDDFDQKHLRTAGVQKIHWCTCLITTWCNSSSFPEV